MSIELKYKQLDWRKSDQKVFVADIGKAKKEFNWMPEINKFTGVRKMLDWVSKG